MIHYGFLLTRQWRDTARGIVLDLWFAGERGPVNVIISGQEAVFFVREVDLPAIEDCLRLANNSQVHNPQVRKGDARLCTMHNDTVLPLYWKSYRAARDAADTLRARRIDCWEVDIRPPERYLMERFITGAVTIDGGTIGTQGECHNPRLRPSEYRPDLKLVSLDIETNPHADELYSIAVYGRDLARIFMVGEVDGDTDLTITSCRDQRECLNQFVDWLQDYDPDVLIGWNLVQFDLWVLESISQGLQQPLHLGRGNQTCHWREDADNNRRYVQIPGRVALDGIEILRASFYSFTSYSLENVAQNLLGEGKLSHSSERVEDIVHWFHHDKAQLAKYNLMDCQLVWDIFEQESLTEFVVERSQLTGLPMDRLGGSVASFDYLYLPLLHRKGYVAPNLGEVETDVVSPGGYVLDSQPGIFRNVLVLDFKSLYPSIIRTFNIDPYAYWIAQHQALPDTDIVPGFNDARFAKDEHLLPGVIERLWQARDKAKRDGNGPLSQAIKIIMNSFYGVLGSTGCRFFDPRVCSSITLRGHEIIRTSRDWIEEQGHRVIYGDTDSLFVWVGDEATEDEAVNIGQQLAQLLNERWRNLLAEELGVDSALEIEFETHYLQFVMPTIRGSKEGSKKRYAGTVKDGDETRLVFKGLENVRTDWTELAKQFQERLYREVFAGHQVEDYVRELVNEVMAGERDHQLIYRKRLRRHLKDYQKNIPPHVQAAHKRWEWQGIETKKGDWIDYIITVQGPEPVDDRRNPIDYQHYIDRQLAPVADGVLQFVGSRFSDITAPQLSLFQ